MAVRLEYQAFTPDKPIYDYRSNRWIWTPGELVSSFEAFPLTLHFIDWVAGENYQIDSRTSMGSRSADAYTFFGIREILLKNSLSTKKANEAIMHELVHIAVPYATDIIGNPAMEKAIDDVALSYSKNEEFMRYAKGEIPFFCKARPPKIVFPTLPISDRYDIQYLD